MKSKSKHKRGPATKPPKRKELPALPVTMPVTEALRRIRQDRRYKESD